MYELDSSFSGDNPVADAYEHGNKLAVCLKSREIFDRLSDYRLMRRQSPACR